MTTDGEAARPRDAEIPRANVRSAPKTGACATTAYSPDCYSPSCPKKTFEIPKLWVVAVNFLL